MIKTTLTPANNPITVNIPDTYIGKLVEVIIYPVDEIEKKNLTQNTMSSYKGILSKETAASMQEEILQNRKEWY